MTGARAYVVFCHPTRDSLVGAALDRTIAGLEASGHEVRVSDLYAEGFEPAFTADDLAHHRVDHREHPELRADIATYIEHLGWCDTLVLVHPTWWSGQPAMLKGWIDRVFVSGVAWTFPDGAVRLHPALTNVRRIVAVTTHGSSKFVNALQGESGKRIMTRSIRTMCHRRCRTDWIALYGVDRCTDAERRAFLDRLEHRLSRR